MAWLVAWRPAAAAKTGSVKPSFDRAGSHCGRDRVRRCRASDAPGTCDNRNPWRLKVI